MKSSTLLTAFCPALLTTLLATPASAESVILIDLNTIEGSGAVGGTWNAYDAPSDIDGSELKDSSGATLTGVTLSKSGTMTDSSTTGTVYNNTSPDSQPSWATSSTDNNASGDYFFTSTSSGAQSFTLTIDGLTSGHTFSLDLLASRYSENANGFYEYSLDDGSNWSGFDVLNSDGTDANTGGWDTFNTQTQGFDMRSQGYVLHRYMNISDVTLTGTTLQIRTTDASTSDGDWSALNAARLTLIPEPSMIWLVLMIGSAVFVRRPRRQV